MCSTSKIQLEFYQKGLVNSMYQKTLSFFIRESEGRLIESAFHVDGIGFDAQWLQLLSFRLLTTQTKSFNIFTN